MPKFAVILPAAGKSRRFGDSIRKKVFVPLGGRPVWARSAEAFSHRKDVVQTIVVIAPEDEEWFHDTFHGSLMFMNVEVALGGAQRGDSVENGLKQVRDDVDFVAIHDAARPLIAKSWIDDVFDQAEASGAAILATPLTSTIKRVENDNIIETVDRDHLWAAQTPQVFRKDWLMEAYANRGDFQGTDEAQLVERQGHQVSVVTGSPLNLKITTADDLRMAEQLVQTLPKDHLSTKLEPEAAPKPGLW